MHSKRCHAASWLWKKVEQYLLWDVYMLMGFKKGDFLPKWSPSFILRGTCSGCEEMHAGLAAIWKRPLLWR